MYQWPLQGCGTAYGSLKCVRGPDNIFLVSWSPPTELRGMPLKEFEEKGDRQSVGGISSAFAAIACHFLINGKHHIQSVYVHHKNLHVFSGSHLLHGKHDSIKCRVFQAKSNNVSSH